MRVAALIALLLAMVTGGTVAAQDATDSIDLSVSVIDSSSLEPTLPVDPETPPAPDPPATPTPTQDPIGKPTPAAAGPTSGPETVTQLPKTGSGGSEDPGGSTIPFLAFVVVPSVIVAAGVAPLVMVRFRGRDSRVG